MKQQITEILERLGKNWRFVDLRVKLSPHTPAIVIKTIRKEDEDWIVEWDNAEMKLNEIEHKEALATIYQRLKIIEHASEAPNK